MRVDYEAKGLIEGNGGRCLRDHGRDLLMPALLLGKRPPLHCVPPLITDRAISLFHRRASCRSVALGRARRSLSQLLQAAQGSL